MRLGDIRSGKTGAVFTAPTRPVEIKVISKDSHGVQTVADATAILAFVSEDERDEAMLAAEKAVRAQFPDGVLPDDRLADARTYHLLARALRDSDDSRTAFASSVDELKSSMHRRDAVRVYDEYERFCAEEFPARVDHELFEKLKEDFKKKPLPDLLSSYESSEILRAMPSLLVHFGRSTTPTSGDGTPA